MFRLLLKNVVLIEMKPYSRTKFSYIWLSVWYFVYRKERVIPIHSFVSRRNKSLCKLNIGNINLTDTIVRYPHAVCWCIVPRTVAPSHAVMETTVSDCSLTFLSTHNRSCGRHQSIQTINCTSTNSQTHNNMHIANVIV